MVSCGEVYKEMKGVGGCVGIDFDCVVRVWSKVVRFCVWWVLCYFRERRWPWYLLKGLEVLFLVRFGLGQGFFGMINDHAGRIGN